MIDLYLTRLPATLRDYWRTLERCGWLDDVVEHRHEGIHQRLSWHYERDPRYAYSALAVYAFDAESIYDVGPRPLSYYRRLNDMAKASDGVFAPDDVHDEFIPGLLEVYRGIRVSFGYGRHVYEYEARLSDYFDGGVLDMVNAALRDSGQERYFHALPASDHMLHLALVSETTYRRAALHGLIPMPEYFTAAVHPDFERFVELYDEVLRETPPDLDSTEEYFRRRFAM